MKTRVISTFLPDVKMKLPKEYKSSKGRGRFASKLINTFQKHLNKFPEGKIPIDDYRDIVYKTLYPIRPDLNVFVPEDNKIAHVNLNINVKMLNRTNYDHEIVHKGYNIFLPNVDNNITCNNPTIIHETRHLFDFMCNPKYICPRGNHFFKKNNREDVIKFGDILADIKSDNYKAPKLLGLFKQHNFEQIMREKIKNFDNEFVIELLQRCRYSVQMEINAYKEMEIYALKVNPLNCFTTLVYHKKINDKYEFSHKKSVLEKLLKEYLNSERAILRETFITKEQ